MQELRAALPGYEYGLFDQTALAFLLKSKPSLMSKVRGSAQDHTRMM